MSSPPTAAAASESKSATPADASSAAPKRMPQPGVIEFAIGFPPQKAKPECGECGKALTAPLSLCAKCKLVAYCDEKCKEKAWEYNHEFVCGKPFEPSIYIPLAYPDEALEEMQQADEIVITDPKITLVVNYPLSRAVEFELKASKPEGFTRRELASQICELYQRIYAEEEQSAKKPKSKSVTLNRDTSYGKYGIRMHDIDDLLLHTVYKKDNGKYGLGIDS